MLCDLVDAWKQGKGIEDNKVSPCETWRYLCRPPAFETIIEDTLLWGNHWKVACRGFCLNTSMEE